MIKKTIWIINQYVGSPYHGMEYRHYYLALNFIKQGYDVYVFSGSYSHLHKKSPEIMGKYTFQKIDGINYCWVKTPKYNNSGGVQRIFNMISFMISLFQFKADNLPTPDGIIVSSPSPFPIVNGYFWAKKLKAKLIFEVRDLWPLTLKELNGMPFYHPLILFMQLFEDFAYKKSDFVVSLLSNSFKYMKNHGLDQNKFVYIPNGVELEEISNAEPLDDEIKNLIPKDKFIVGYTGTLGKSNAMKYFAEAATILKNRSELFFIIVGDGYEKDSLKEITIGLDNVLYIDSVNKKQVQSVLKLFDACYLGWSKKKLYEYGVSANKTFDYMYSQKPIVHSSNVVDDIVQKANCGIITEPQNPDDIANGILKLYSMTEEERQKLGENGKEFLLKNHTYDVLAKKYLELI